MGRRIQALIKARRIEIEENAPCEGCGATLASCKSARGKDPTAPSWFGCCAQGTALLPCRHVPDVWELLKFLKQIERGGIKPAPEPIEQAEDLLSQMREPISGMRRRVMPLILDHWPDDVPIP